MTSVKVYIENHCFLFCMKLVHWLVQFSWKCNLLLRHQIVGREQKRKKLLFCLPKRCRCLTNQIYRNQIQFSLNWFTLVTKKPSLVSFWSKFSVYNLLLHLQHIGKKPCVNFGIQPVLKRKLCLYTRTPSPVSDLCKTRENATSPCVTRLFILAKSLEKANFYVYQKGADVLEFISIVIESSFIWFD